MVKLSHMKNLILLFMVSFAATSSAQISISKSSSDIATFKNIDLYDVAPAESNGLEGKERYDPEREFIYDIAHPRMDVYLPASDKATGRAVVICPGGGYSGLAINREGYMTAEWFTGQGIAAILLYYRMPGGHWEVPLADVHQAIYKVRARAEEWNIDPGKVGIIGFSAGGHLASTAAVKFDDSTRPDFAILIYPVISLDEKYMHKGSRDNLLGKPDPQEKQVYDALVNAYSANLNVTSRTPPVFLALSDDDKVVPPVNSTLLYSALKENGIPAELHIYPAGGHGWGFRENFTYRDEFQTSLSRWLQELP